MLQVWLHAVRFTGQMQYGYFICRKEFNNLLLIDLHLSLTQSHRHSSLMRQVVIISVFRFRGRGSYAFAHFGICLQIFETVIVHDA